MPFKDIVADRALNSGKLGLAYLSKNGLIQQLNDVFCKITGYSPGELINTKLQEILHKEDLQQGKIKVKKTCLNDPLNISREIRLIRRDNTIIWTNLTISDNINQNSNEQNFIVSIEDIHKQKENVDYLKKLALAIEQNPFAVMITNYTGEIEYVNARFTMLTGYNLKEIKGKKPEIFQSENASWESYKEMQDTILSGTEWRGELCNRKKNGAIYWEYTSVSPIFDESGNIIQFLTCKEDISNRKQYEIRLLEQLNYDSLTGLPNRLLLLDRLSQAMAKVRRDKKKLVLMCINLDNFKYVCSSMGYEAGDLLLIEVAQRLKSCIRQGDTVARHSADEFLLILTDLSDISIAEIRAKDILNLMAESFNINDRDITISASIGKTIYPNDGDNPHILLQNADAAMHRAKEEGKNRYSFFRPEMNITAAYRLNLESKLRTAIQKNEMFMVYQPIVCLNQGYLIGAEALIRWNNPELGFIPPDQFISLAEESNLIDSIGLWTIEQACDQLSKWSLDGMTNFKMAINISSRQFFDLEFPQNVFAILDKYSVSPKNIEFEITERLLLEEMPTTKKLVSELKDKGISFSLDDFGTGYSSLGILKKFPFDTVKIDKMFIRDIKSNPNDISLVKAIISIGKSMNLTVVAEGVETKDALEILNLNECDLVQGYYFSKPLLVEDFSRYYREFNMKSFL